MRFSGPHNVSGCKNMEQTKRKRAPGAGRPPKPPGEKRVKTAITMRPDLYDRTAGDRSGIIEEALLKHFNQPQGASD